MTTNPTATDWTRTESVPDRPVHWVRTRSRRYSARTVARALVQAAIDGVILDWAWDDDRKRFTVDVYDYGTFVGTTHETHGLVIGLRAATRRAERENA